MEIVEQYYHNTPNEENNIKTLSFKDQLASLNA